MEADWGLTAEIVVILVPGNDCDWKAPSSPVLGVRNINVFSLFSSFFLFYFFISFFILLLFFKHDTL